MLYTKMISTNSPLGKTGCYLKNNISNISFFSIPWGIARKFIVMFLLTLTHVCLYLLKQVNLNSEAGRKAFNSLPGFILICPLLSAAGSSDINLPGGRATAAKILAINFSVRNNFYFTELSVKYVEALSYLAGVITAKLWRETHARS